MTSVRLTFRLLPEQECSVDCVAESDQSVSVTIQLGSGRGAIADSTVAVNEGPRRDEEKAVDAALVKTDPGSPVKVYERDGMLITEHPNGNRAACFLAHQNPQVGQSKLNPCSQTGIYQSYDGNSQTSTYSMAVQPRDDEDAV